MADRSGTRLIVFGVLVTALILTLGARAVVVHTADTERFSRAAAENSLRTVVVSAPRGTIVDQQGRPLAATRSSVEIVVDRSALLDLPADGADVITDLAGVLGVEFAELDDRLTPCTSPNAREGVCWQGAGYEPVPVASDVSIDVALAVAENPERFPTVSVRTRPVRSYPAPGGARASHVLGYLGPVTAEELAATDSPTALDRSDLLGRAGLEQQYDRELRGVNGRRTVALSTTGAVTEVVDEVPAQIGDTVVSTIDAHLQSVVERELRNAVRRARENPERELAADSGAAVVVDVRNGDILALASFPDYDPTVWIGGISHSDYRRLLDGGALFSVPVNGLYAPGSTFKPFTTVAMGESGYALTGEYPCPSSYRAGGREFRNFESRGYGTISLTRALEVSCNTVFYRVGDELWQRSGGEGADRDAADPIAEVAQRFGLGSVTSVDLPGESAGQVASRQATWRQWQERREAWCAAAEEGYPETRRTDPDLAEQYTALDRENCESGYLWRQGDAMNAAIGQGTTAITPLQLAMAYAALANGGTLYQPSMVKGILDAEGAVVSRTKPVVAARQVASADTLAFLNRALQGVVRQGTASEPFQGFPIDEIPVAAKTGSAQVSGGRPSTSWFASYAPADEPRYAVVMMVTQGGTGSGTSGPSVRAIYDAIFGVAAGQADPDRSVLSGGSPRKRLPRG